MAATSRWRLCPRASDLLRLAPRSDRHASPSRQRESRRPAASRVKFRSRGNIGLARGSVARGIEPGNRGRAARISQQAANAAYGTFVPQGDGEAFAERIDALPLERQEDVRLAASQTLLNRRRRLIDDRIDRPFHEMAREELEDIVTLKGSAVGVAEGRPIEYEVLGHCRGRVRDAVLPGQLHSGENRARFSTHEESVPGEAIGAERLAHESAAAGCDDDRTRKHGPGPSIVSTPEAPTASPSEVMRCSAGEWSMSRTPSFKSRRRRICM